MASSKFCSRCGTLLVLDAATAATCGQCGFQRSLAQLETVETVTCTGPQEFQRQHGIEPLPEVAGAPEEAEKRQRATVDEACPACGHGQLEYYTMQLRSADEGQTVFYECSKCKHKFSQNN